MSLVELHRHSEYSHDGSGKALWAAQYAKELGQTALGLTDHGVITGLVDHYQACNAVGIKPVLGCEIYFQPTFRKPTQDDDINDHLSVGTERYHLTVICRTLEGYKNLCRMLTQATETFYKVPIVTLANLLAHAKGLYLLTGCISSYTSQMIVLGKQDLALECIKRMHDASDGGVYLEVQPFPAPGQEEVNRQLLVWSEIYGYPLVMTSDAHFVKADHFPMHQVMQKVRKPYQDGMLADFSVRHMHTQDSLFDAWSRFMGYPEQGVAAINNTQQIADSCDVIFSTSFKMPVLDWLTDTPTTLLPKLVRQGLIDKELYSIQKGKKILLPEYRERVYRELQVIHDRGFAPYMLLCADVVKFCQDNNILAQARGSVCGSEVAHALRISNVDALTYGTSFERFIGTRTTMPDVDLDIQDNRKGEVVNYVVNKYPGQAAQICTHGTFKQKAAINGIVKAVDMDIVQAELLREYLLQFPDEALPEEVLLAHADAADYVDAIKAYAYMHGQVSFLGKHAAGVAICDGKLSDYMALMRVGSGADVEYVTSYDMEALDYLGILKIDLLGVAGLTIIQETCELAGLSFDDEKRGTIFNDEEVMRHFSSGDTVGVFQSEAGARQLYRQMKPKRWEDLAIITACNRPLPKEEGTFQAVLDGRRGRGKQSFYSEQTKETYGAIVYQEQVHAICMQVAGMTQSQADKVLKGLKKYHDNDNDLAQIFVQGCMQQAGVSEKEATSLWQSMRRYLFNKAHAVSYAMIAAEMMWLRLHYPAFFWLATLNHEGDKNKRRVYVAQAKRDGVGILTPHVNGGAVYTYANVDGREYIQEGLINLEGIGMVTAQAIVRERERNGDFVDSEDVYKRLSHMKAKLAILERNGAISFDTQELAIRISQYVSSLAQVGVI